MVLPPAPSAMSEPADKSLSLKAKCASQIEALILSGVLKIGARLPAERDLAARLGVSRPVVHEALLELAAKGLVVISPRHGVRVTDYPSTGSLALLDSLIAYQEDEADASLRSHLFAFRRLIEKETACLAASNRTKAQLSAMRDILQQEKNVDCSNPFLLTELDFQYHLLIAQASGNLVYPLLLNSFKSAYTSYTQAFFRAHACTAVIQVVFDFHTKLVQAIADQKSEPAGGIMLAMLKHGEESWKGA